MLAQSQAALSCGSCLPQVRLFAIARRLIELVVEDLDELAEVIADRLSGRSRIMVIIGLRERRLTDPVHFTRSKLHRRLGCASPPKRLSGCNTALGPTHIGLCGQDYEPGTNGPGCQRRVPRPRVEEDPPLGVLGKERRVFAPARKNLALRYVAAQVAVIPYVDS